MSSLVSKYVEVIVDEAASRGIEATPCPEINKYIVLLEYKGHKELVYQSAANRLGYVTFKIFGNKALTSVFLERMGYKVPEFIFTDRQQEMLGFLRQHKRIVIKPGDSVQGRGVTPSIISAEQVGPAVERARENTAHRKEQRVICQRHVDGDEYRLLVIDKRHIFAARRVSARLKGDGQHSVKELVDSWNANVLTGRTISDDEVVKSLLAEQGFTFDTVPKKGQMVILAKVANAFAGGTVIDATGQIGDKVRDEAVRLAEEFDAVVVGIDCITDDIKKDIGYVIELNSMPDLLLHHHPTEGKGRNPAGAIVDMLFPETQRPG